MRRYITTSIIHHRVSSYFNTTIRRFASFFYNVLELHFLEEFLVLNNILAMNTQVEFAKYVMTNKLAEIISICF